MNIYDLLIKNGEFHRRAAVTLSTVGDAMGNRDALERSNECFQAAEQYARENDSRLEIREGLILDQTFSADADGYYRLGEYARIRIEGLHDAFVATYNNDPEKVAKVSPISHDSQVVFFKVTT